MSRPICFDLINKVFQEVGTLKQNQKYKDNMDQVVGLIKNEGGFLEIYKRAEVAYTYDAQGNVVGGVVSRRPFRLYEFLEEVRQNF